MKVTTVSVKIERKYNLGDYEGINASVFLSAELDEDDSVSHSLDSLAQEAKTAIKKAVAESIKARQTQAQLVPTYMGKAIEAGINGQNWKKEMV